jgi:ABC-type bacteriocin/lantibiotic exporter with double-glycine peptidase domain
MINSKPKTKTYLSLGIVVMILIVGLGYILADFHGGGTYGLLFYIISCTLLTVVILLILVKMMAGYKFISAGNDRINIRIPLKGLKKSYSLNQVMAWQEEKVTANKREFKQLSLLFDDRTSFNISNHEHLSYAELVKYLAKKIPKKRLKA